MLYLLQNIWKLTKIIQTVTLKFEIIQTVTLKFKVDSFTLIWKLKKNIETIFDCGVCYLKPAYFNRLLRAI